MLTLWINVFVYWLSHYSMAAQGHVSPDSKFHGANMGPTWVLSAPGGSNIGPMNLAIWEVNHFRAEFIFENMKLVDKMCKYEWIRLVLWKMQSGHDSVHRRTDGQTDKVKSVYPAFHFVETRGIITWLLLTQTWLLLTRRGNTDSSLQWVKCPK